MARGVVPGLDAIAIGELRLAVRSTSGVQAVGVEPEDQSVPDLQARVGPGFEPRFARRARDFLGDGRRCRDHDNEALQARCSTALASSKRDHSSIPTRMIHEPFRGSQPP